MNRCIECRRQIDAADTVRLTARSVMCQNCYAEAMAAWHAEVNQAGRWKSAPSYCPGPKELQERIEAIRDKVGSLPNRREPHAVPLPGTILGTPKRVVKRQAARIRKAIGST
jgi:hypothetical protein